MAFQPSTEIYIGTVPFDNTYKHVYYIPDRAAQYSYFQSCCPHELRRNDYTYQRTQNTVVVPYNAEQLYGYNYCMFQNANYGSRWFYSFIVDIEYVNESSSRLYLQLDVFQTWFPDCHVPACSVEREHVNDDSLGLHIKDEGLNPGELMVNYAKEYKERVFHPCVSSAVEPNKDGSYVNVRGDVYDGVASGTAYTLFRNIGELGDFMTALSDNGQQDAVSAVWLVPNSMTVGKLHPKPDGYGEWIKGGGMVDVSETIGLDLDIYSLTGYTPKNNKTLIYPNQYLEVTNFAGTNSVFRLEFFKDRAHPAFAKTGGLSPNSCVNYIPLDYNNNPGRCEEMTVTLPPYPTCDWVYQTWANNVGQHQFELFGMQLNSLTAIPAINAGAQFATGHMQNASNALNNVLGNVDRGTGYFGSKESAANAGKSSKLGMIGAVADLAVGAGSVNVGYMQNIAEMNANLSLASRQPNTVRGGLNSSTNAVNIGSYGVGFRHYQCRYEFAKQIDDYYSTYGYLVLETKVPNITGRRSWNFVKTSSANVQGKVPPYALKAFNAMLDSGITFWHTPDVGNYSLDNDII